MTELLVVEGLKKEFGSLTAVDAVSFSVPKGQVLGFLGPNGAGKSTTMKMITGFLPMDEGKVEVTGIELDKRPVDARRAIGYLPEGAPLYSDMTAGGFLEFVARARGIPSKEIDKRIADAVSQLDIAEVLDRPIDVLSKGFKRRVGLAQAVIHDPPILILDEPTDGLDPNQKHEVRQLIRRMVATKAIVLSTHILEEVEAVCDRVIIINAGRVVFDGTPVQLASSVKPGSVKVTISTAVAESDIGGALTSLSGITDHRILYQGEHGVSVELDGEDPPALASAICDVVAQKNWRLDEISMGHGRLEEVFRDLTRSDASRT